MKELMSRMQLKMRTESESSGENAVNETQMRVKYEHSQRQIDSLKEEIERLNRRAQNSMNSQQSAAQQRELAKLQKEAAAAVKALATKKQEIDLIKRQLNERDAREAEYKRTVLRLQNEVAAVKATAHSAAKKPAA
jgi:structural maintenance of chromosome 4